MSKEMVPANGAELTPKADWLAPIPMGADDEDVAEQIAASVASAGSVDEALGFEASTIKLSAFAGHRLRILGARLMEGTASGEPGFYAVIDAVNLTDGLVRWSVDEGGKEVFNELPVTAGDRVTLNTGAPNVLAVLAVAYKTNGVPFETTPYLVQSKNNPKRSHLHLGRAEQPFD